MQASRTLQEIARVMELDGGAVYRSLLSKTLPELTDVYSGNSNAFRSHMGASLMGLECSRSIWYTYRWVTEPKFPARILRLFNRGHLEEGRVIALLLMIGCKVWSKHDGRQLRIKSDTHFGGSLDAVVKGILELPEVPMLLEVKTHNDKSFQAVKEDGIAVTKWTHFIQMQLYMGKMNLTKALYFAVNKNDDDIYAEIVDFDKMQYDKYYDRAKWLIIANEPPPKINSSPGWYLCKFCSHLEVCHLGKAPERNCRTCQNFVIGDRDYGCRFHKKKLSENEQLNGCNDYTLNIGMQNDSESTMVSK